MTNDRGALLAIAERIADAENRITQLRTRIERLRTRAVTRPNRTRCSRSCRATSAISTSSNPSCAAAPGPSISPRRDRAPASESASDCRLFQPTAQTFKTQFASITLNIAQRFSTLTQSSRSAAAQKGPGNNSPGLEHSSPSLASVLGPRSSTFRSRCLARGR